jgi:hypothetical protein
VHAWAPSARRHHGCVDIRDLRVQLVDDELQLTANGQGPFHFFHHSDELVHLWAFAPCRVAVPPIPFVNHAPRVEIDGVVLRREEWNVPKAAILPGGETALDRFYRTWSARADLRIPERVFVHVTNEIKPFHIDLASYESFRLFEHVVRHENNVRMVEMLPTPEAFWLADEGGRYATEFRFLALRTCAQSRK